eukprot:11494-Heterococcus_DN1.PRE.4
MFAISALLRYAVCTLLLLALLEKSSVVAAEDDARRQRLAIDGQEFAICMIVKDQNRDIREWIHYHRSMGMADRLTTLLSSAIHVISESGFTIIVQRDKRACLLVQIADNLHVSQDYLQLCSTFYIYDDGGNGDTPANHVLQDYIDANIVVYHDVSGTGSSTSQQLSVYNDCINSYKKHHKWMAFIDVDEFIVVPDQKATIPSTLQRFDRPG